MQAIILIGLIVLGVWTKRWIDALNGTVTALKGTVDAQSQTITSQKTLLENLGNVLNATDTPKMLERLEAYKKFVDHEKDAIKQRLEAYKKSVDQARDDELQRAEASFEKSQEILDELESRLRKFINEA
jgi:hypothetical protein